MNKVSKLSLPISIIIASLIFGGFYSYTQHQKQLSIERQVQMKIDQENQERMLEEAEEARQLERDAEIREICSDELDRKGNYLVSNETLQTNYEGCLHSYGL